MNDYQWMQNEAAPLYVEEEWSLREIAAEFGYEKSAVTQWLRKMGIEIRRGGRGATSRDLANIQKQDLSYLRTPESIAKMAKTKSQQDQPWLHTPESVAKRNATYTSEKHSEVLKKLWQDPAYRAKLSKARSEQAKKRWAEGNWRNSTRVSKIEYAFAPGLIEQGFIHNVDASFTISTPSKSHIPDFYNEAEKKVVEIWGRYWHGDEKPESLVRWYARQGWSCKVLWEDDPIV
jgi:hypothetical protein